MMALFEKLFSLRIKYASNPLEDFLTEIFAECLSSDPDFFKAFLERVDINFEYDQYQVNTQESFKALKHHLQDSQPDMSIYLSDQVVFIENKVASQEGDEQLQRYAEQLDAVASRKEGTLLYITRDYDKKHASVITAKCQRRINFKQLRWYEVYQVAKKHTDNHLIKELVIFMESRNLYSTNQFQPLDILSLTNFSRVKKMMDDSMYGPVEELFTKEMGGKSQNSVSMTQLRDHDRYIYLKYLANGVWVGLGYWLNSFNEKQYPELRFVMEVPPNSSKYQEIKSIMREISNEDSSDWTGYNLHEPNTYAGIYIGSSLKKFLNKENHIWAIQDFFVDSINDFKLKKQRFAELI